MGNIAQAINSIKREISEKSSVEDICQEMKKAMYAIELLKSTIPAEIIEAIASHEETIAAARELLKEQVVKTQQTFKSDFGLTIVFNNGRETWDSKGLNGYAVVHPEIACFKKIGKPYASIKEMK